MSSHLQFSEDFGEECRLAVNAEHLGAKSVDDQEAPVPEFVFAVFNQEWLKGITYFVTHVTVAQIETRQNCRLKLLL